LSSDPVQPPAHLPESPPPKLNLKRVVVISVVIVVVLVAVAVAFPILSEHGTSPSKSQATPIFAFLPSSVLNSTYGMGFTAHNDSSNLSSSLMFSSIVVKDELWLYGPDNSTDMAGTVAIMIFQMNSTSAVSTFMSDFKKLLTNSTSPSFSQISNGTSGSFLYSLYNFSVNDSGIENVAQVFVAHDGTFVLLMEFINPIVIGKDMTVFTDQVKFMLPSDNAPSPVMSVAISGSVGGVPLSEIVTVLLTIVAGLFIGLAVKKGIMAFVFAIIGFLIVGYVGIAFIPTVSLPYEIHKWSSFLLNYISTVKLGAIQLTLSVILFLIGLAIGLWKG
jgi:hypothetical protein